MLVGEGIPQIPTHRQQNHFPWILTTFERIPGGDRHALRYQIRSRRKFATKPNFLLHDRHKTFSVGLDEAVASWGIEVLKSPAHAPTANAFCERLIGSIRRECLDCVIPLIKSHLKRTLREWVNHYNTGRPHQSLGPGIPDQVELELPTNCEIEPISQERRIIAKSILGGLHHEYRWADAA